MIRFTSVQSGSCGHPQAETSKACAHCTTSPIMQRLSPRTTPLSRPSSTSKHRRREEGEGGGVYVGAMLPGSGPHCNTFQDHTRQGKNNRSDASDGELSFQPLRCTCQRNKHAATLIEQTDAAARNGPDARDGQYLRIWATFRCCATFCCYWRY